MQKDRAHSFEEISFLGTAHIINKQPIMNEGFIYRDKIKIKQTSSTVLEFYAQTHSHFSEEIWKSRITSGALILPNISRSILICQLRTIRSCMVGWPQGDRSKRACSFWTDFRFFPTQYQWIKLKMLFSDLVHGT